MAYTAIITSNIQWTPPAAPVNSGLSSFTTPVSYNEQNVGVLGVPAGTPPSTLINIPFGSVSQAKILSVKNMMTSDIDIRLNGSVGASFTLPPNGRFTYECPTDPTTGVTPMASATITTLVSPTNFESISFHIFGD